MTPRLRRPPRGGSGPQSGTQSTFRRRLPQLPRRHWPAAAAGVIGAGALVVALAVSGGVGAGAQSGSTEPPPGAGTATGAEGAGSADGDRPTASSEHDSAGGGTQPDAGATGEDGKGGDTPKVKVAERGPGTFRRARVDGSVLGEGGRLLRFDVRVEKGLPFDADETALAIQATLADPRSWVGSGEARLELVSNASRADFTIFLATPGTTDRYCRPLRTYGRVSCQAGNRVVLNAWRWAHGADAYGTDVGAYRQYLVNHEVGHRLGHYHVGCPGKGKRAPVMMQQTKGVGACRANPWAAPKRGG